MYLSDGGSFTIACVDANGEVYYFSVSGNLYDRRENFGFYYARSNGLFPLPYYPAKGGTKEKETIENLLTVIKDNVSETIYLKLITADYDEEIIDNDYTHLFSIVQFLQQRQGNQ